MLWYRAKYSLSLDERNQSSFILAGRIKVRLAWLLAILLLITSGIVYSIIAYQFKLVIKAPIILPVPLESFPKQFGNWTSTDVNIPATTREYMERNFADDYISRRYVNDLSNIWADVYVVYCSSRPGGILGHQPRVCYPANGWVHDSTECSQFTTQTGRQVDCLIHIFHKPAPMRDRMIILNFYILNGQITADENDFSSPFSRRPNISRNPARYVAQVQISSVLENSVRTAARDMTDMILALLPDEKGQVGTEDF